MNTFLDFARAAFAAVVVFRIDAAFHSNAVKIFKQVVEIVQVEFLFVHNLYTYICKVLSMFKKVL